MYLHPVLSSVHVKVMFCSLVLGTWNEEKVVIGGVTPAKAYPIRSIPKNKNTKLNLKQTHLLRKE